MTTALRGASASVSQIVAIVVGCALLLARPALVDHGSPRLTLATLYIALLVVGAVVAPRVGRLLPSQATVPALVVGFLAFGVGRLLTGGDALAWAGDAVMLDALAAVGEEAFFRRLTYDALLPRGEGVAVGGAALLFAAVHVTFYGWWVLPLDLAAGLVLSWQRWATGSWGVPALTHVAANLMMRA